MLAVVGALAPAAAMAQSTVEIYGRANLGMDNWRASGSSVAGGDIKSRNRVYDSGSRFGFRVNEGLGGGMRAFVVMQTGVNLDSGTNLGQSGSPNASSGFWASFDSYLGLGGGWGDVRWGRQSIWWSNGIIVQTGANYINAAAASITNGGFGSVAGPVARQSNVISYHSPTIGGFNASLSYSPDANTEGAGFTGTDQARESVWGITGRYTASALRAQVDWARRSNVGLVTDRDNTGLKVGVGWAYVPGAQISFIAERLDNKNIVATNGLVVAGLAAPLDDPKVYIFLVNWEHMLGQWQLLAMYGWSGNVKGLSISNDQTRARAFTLGAKYFLSKRTGMYVSLNQFRNERNAWGDFVGAGNSSATGGALRAANRGADPRIIAVGVMHNF